MSGPKRIDPPKEDVPDPHRAHTDGPPTRHGWSHRWAMIACCIPMIAIAVGLVVAGVAGASAVLFALLCLAMMAVMMVGMGHGRGGHSGHR